MPNRSRSVLVFLLLVAAPIAAARGQAPAPPPENCPCPPPPPPPPLWTGSLGVSYLATTGNTDTESFGLTADWVRTPTPWGVEIHALANRAESEGVTTAERLFGAVRGRRSLSERFEAFGGFSYEQNEFAGFDARLVVEAGVLWKAIQAARHELAFDAGLTWTEEEPVLGEKFDSFGALAGFAWVWKIGEHATLKERFLYFPNFDESDDWRLSSETALDAALATSWALRVGYLYTRDNLPAPGFEKEDGATTLSLVWKR